MTVIFTQVSDAYIAGEAPVFLRIQHHGGFIVPVRNSYEHCPDLIDQYGTNLCNIACASNEVDRCIFCTPNPASMQRMSRSLYIK